jgi:hypothetical protein
LRKYQISGNFEYFDEFSFFAKNFPKVSILAKSPKSYCFCENFRKKNGLTRRLIVARTGNLASALGCALAFALEAKFEIEAKISFRLEAKKKPDFT